jgi:peptidoglycan/LPS O-acetylase OafA/YrhL
MSLPPRLSAALRGTHLPGLDALRVLAVGLVMVYHFGFQAARGGLGVVVFFVLSGFLITWLLLRELATNDTIALGAFYRRRALRIFPAAYVYGVLLIALWLVLRRPIPWGHVLSAFLYVSNYYNALLGDPNNGFSHTWSLAIEEQFYLLWPMALLLCHRRGWLTHKVLVGVILAIWAYRTVLAWGFDVDQAYVYAAFDTRADALLVGCLLAVLVKQERWTPVLRAVTASPMLPLVTIAAGTLVATGDQLGIPRYRDVIAFALIPPLVAVLIVQVLALSDTAMWRWLEHPALRYLGRISYPMYLYQQVTLSPARKLLGAFPVPVQLVGAFAITIAVAALSYRFVEQPFLRMKDRMSEPRLPSRLPMPTA